jgi:hypothetical protein
LWIVLTVAPVAAQSVRLVPNIAVAETEYRDAREAWLRNDPNLVQDLYSAPPAEMRKRIEREAVLRDDVMSKKAVYFDFLVKRFDEIRTRLAGVKGGTVPVAQVTSDLQAEQSRLLAEQESVEARLADIPPGDEYTLVRRAMEAEKADLIQLQNNVAMRIHWLGKIGQEAQTSAQSDSLGAKLDELTKTWEDERQRAIRSRAEWAKYYRDLERSLDDKTPSTSSRPAAPGRPIAVEAPGIAGTWIYRSQPGAWNGFGEPLAVLLQIQTVGNRVEGVYSARLPSRDGIRDITLTLQGQIVSTGRAIVKWTSDKPVSRGEIDLQFSSDGKVWVRRTKSEDGYVPLGAEVLSPK